MYKRGSKYFAWNPLTGKREATGCTDRKAAQSVVAGWERQHADPAWHDASTKTLADLWELVRREKAAQERAVGTLEVYEEKFVQIARVAGIVHPRLGERTPVVALCAPAWVDSFVAQREIEGVSRSTIFKELVCLRQSLRFAERLNWTPANWRAAFKVGFSDGYVPRTAHLPYQRWLDLVGAFRSQHRRAHVAWMLGTGANYSEAAKAAAADISDDSVRIHGTKSLYRDRTVPIFEPMAPFVGIARAWLEAHEGFPRWTSSNQVRDLAKACERAGLPKLTSNDLRRSFATVLARSGLPFELLAKIMGHGSTHMVTRVYAQLKGKSLVETAIRSIRQWDVGGTDETKRDETKANEE